MPLRDILSDMKLPLTFITLIKIITTILIYLFLIVALYYSIRIILIKTTESFDIIVFCKYFLEKVANSFSIVLQLHFPHYCK